MSHSSQTDQSTGAGPGYFATTHWTVVLMAGRSASAQAADALATLCQTYWYPLYAYVRRQGHSADDAQDLTQEFFARLLAKNYLASVNREKGKFRSFLLAALKHFLADEWDRTRRIKRGGGRAPVSLDDKLAETRYCLEPAHELTPEKLYERRWALTLLEQVLARLEEEFIRNHKKRLFDVLQVFLPSGQSTIPYADVAAQLELTEGAVKVAVHRLRRRYRELLRAEVAHTVASADEIDGEIRHLFAVLGP